MKDSGVKLSSSMTSKSNTSAYFDRDPCSVSIAAIFPLGPAKARARTSAVKLLPPPAGPIRATRPLALYFTALVKGLGGGVKSTAAVVGVGGMLPFPCLLLLG